MATAREIVARALRRIRVTPVGETPSNEDAALGLSILNGMVSRWASQGVQTFASTFVLDDEFSFFVPPADATAEVIAALSNQGNWDADANSPALATGTGTKGHFYKVSTAGATVLDDVASWAVRDYAVFDGLVWLKSLPSARFDQAVIDMLALELTQDYGKEPGAVLARSAETGWRQIMAAYIKAQTAGWDAGITTTYARPWIAGAS